VATASVADDQALEATYAALTLMLSKRQHFGVVIDVRGAFSNPTRRKRLSAWVEEHRHVLDHFVVGIATVVDTSLERGAVTAALWLIPTPVEVRVFSVRDEGERWIRDLLGER
jgi:hypothetical protein